MPEDKKKDFEKAVLENYKTMTDYDNQAKKLDAANGTIKANDTAMKDLQGKLDGFKDVDVSGLNQRIKDLETERANIKDYDAKIADRDFNDLVKESIAAVKGKNPKAITALLDVETLKASKNQRGHCRSIESLSRSRRQQNALRRTGPNPVGTGNLIGQVRAGGGSNAR